VLDGVLDGAYTKPRGRGCSIERDCALGGPMTTAARRQTRAGWVIVASSVPMFMVSLNNLVVTNALPQIARDLGADIEQLGWVINAYVLAFAGLLLTGAALGDRFGRKRVFVAAVVVFSIGSAACALAPTVEWLLAARALQGVGAAAVLPLSLTVLASAVPEARRSLAIGLWSGINGLAVAIGPLVGGAVVEGLAWQWIFWVNLPVGALAVPIVLWAIGESRGEDRSLDVPGMLLATVAVTLAVWAIVEVHDAGWTSPRVLAAFAAAVVLLAGFVLWERRVASPLLPLRFYRIRSFVLSNIASVALFFGVFGSIFFLTQYLQGPLGYDAFEAGVRTLPWTALPMLVAPLAGALTDRVGGGRLMAVGLAMQAVALGWIASMATVDLPYPRLVAPMIVAGVGMGLMIAPVSAVVLSSVRDSEVGKASGANNTLRELGGALGIAVLVTVFQHGVDDVPVRSAADAAQAFVHGMVPAIWVGVVVVLAGAVAAAFIPARLPTADAPAVPEAPTTAVSAVSGT
jgi:EmrB/QacA subfamily drug resistance transporter